MTITTPMTTDLWGWSKAPITVTATRQPIYMKPRLAWWGTHPGPFLFHRLLVSTITFVCGATLWQYFELKFHLVVGFESRMPASSIIHEACLSLWETHPGLFLFYRLLESSSTSILDLQRPAASKAAGTKKKDLT